MAYKFYEFFAGGGMASYGLGPDWECLLANDIDEKKADAYKANLPNHPLIVGDVTDLTLREIRGRADLAWASFPCQDLSLAGSGAGLKGVRSGTFWPFWNHMRALKADGRAPRTIVLENVYGAITSHGGKDFAAIVGALSDGGYRFGPLVVDAAHFVPQSRPRLFIVAIRDDIEIPAEFDSFGPDDTWHPPALARAREHLSPYASARWIWWSLPKPAVRNVCLSDLIEEEPQGVEWHSAEQTAYVLSLMNENNIAKVESAKQAGRRIVGTVYRRTRPDGNGGKAQRAEVRFDEIAGCLRTPSGGSSRQTVLIVEGDNIRSRLLSPREGARLMGLPDEYLLPARYNDAYHLVGDGVVAPAVRHLAENLLEPILTPKAVRNAA